jgi:hypothetical protein
MNSRNSFSLKQTRPYRKVHGCKTSKETNFEPIYKMIIFIESKAFWYGRTCIDHHISNYGAGGVYTMYMITIIKAFYHKGLHPVEN